MDHRQNKSVSTSQYPRVSIQTLSVFYICLTTITIQFQYMKQNPIELCSFSLFAATSSITWIDVRQTPLSIDLKLKSHDAVLLQGRTRWGVWGGWGGWKPLGGSTVNWRSVDSSVRRSEVSLPWHRDRARPAEVKALSWRGRWRKATSCPENGALGYVNNSAARLRWQERQLSS